MLVGFSPSCPLVISLLRQLDILLMTSVAPNCLQRLLTLVEFLEIRITFRRIRLSWYIFI